MATIETLPQEVRLQILLILLISRLNEGLVAAEKLEDCSAIRHFPRQPSRLTYTIDLSPSSVIKTRESTLGTAALCANDVNNLQLVNKSFYLSITLVLPELHRIIDKELSVCHETSLDLTKQLIIQEPKAAALGVLELTRTNKTDKPEVQALRERKLRERRRQTYLCLEQMQVPTEELSEVKSHIFGIRPATILNRSPCEY